VGTPDRLQSELDNLVQASLLKRWQAELSEERYQEVLSDMLSRRISLWQAVDILVGGES